MLRSVFIVVFTKLIIERVEKQIKAYTNFIIYNLFYESQKFSQNFVLRVVLCGVVHLTVTNKTNMELTTN